jgi:hypothetical protein
MLLEEFVALVVFHWVTWRSVRLLPKFLCSNPWHCPLPLMCLLKRPKLIGGERRRLTQFLRAYRSCFAFNMKELGALIGPSIRIELASDTPIFRHPYRYNDIERDLIRSRTLDLLEARLVKLSHGEYASATIMPTKKDVHGNYMDRWMCGDYRPINQQTKFDKYAMPTYEEIFDVVGHARVFSLVCTHVLNTIQNVTQDTYIYVKPMYSIEFRIILETYIRMQGSTLTLTLILET